MQLPTCLVFSGHDPCGGAGLQADIETLASIGVHAMTVITASTVQDTTGVYQVEPVSQDLLARQARALLADTPPDAIKIGMLPDAVTVKTVHRILADVTATPVVLDPVIRAGDGAVLQHEAARDAVKTLLFPLTTVVTPNEQEASAFCYAAGADVDACGAAMLALGCQYALITGGDSEGEQVTNRLYADNRPPETFVWPRLPHQYHGSGCTLAAAIAGLLARGHQPLAALREAQQFTWNALRHAYRVGRGQLIPRRFYAADKLT